MRICVEHPLSCSAVSIPAGLRATSADNFGDEKPKRVIGSNSPWTTIQSLGFRTSQRIDRNGRVCGRFAIARGLRERFARLESAEFGKTYTGAILAGPRIIAIHSPISEGQSGMVGRRISNAFAPRVLQVRSFQ